MNRVYNFNHYFLRPYSLVNGVLLPTQTNVMIHRGLGLLS